MKMRLKMDKILNDIEWIAIFESGHDPEIFVNVSNFQARIIIHVQEKDSEEGKYIDITNHLPKGQRLAEKAVKEGGGSVYRSGWYPPTVEIMEAIQNSL